MGKGSGGTRAKFKKPGDSEAKKYGFEKANAKLGSIKLTGKASLDSIPDKRLRQQTRAVISKHFKKYGFDTDSVYLANMGGALGLHVSYGKGGRHEVILNKGAHANHKALAKKVTGAYQDGFLVHTKNPAQHVMVHEMSHARWTDSRGKSEKVKGQVKKLYDDYINHSNEVAKKYGKDNYKKKLGVSYYATANVNEFWAESSTQYHMGKKQSKWSKAVGKIWEKEFGKKEAGKASLNAGGRNQAPKAAAPKKAAPKKAAAKPRVAATSKAFKGNPTTQKAFLAGAPFKYKSGLSNKTFTATAKPGKKAGTFFVTVKDGSGKRISSQVVTKKEAADNFTMRKKNVNSFKPVKKRAKKS